MITAQTHLDMKSLMFFAGRSRRRETKRLRSGYRRLGTFIDCKRWRIRETAMAVYRCSQTFSPCINLPQSVHQVLYFSL